MQAKKILATVASFCLIGAANAQTSFTWVGGDNGGVNDWNIAANWNPSNAGYPGQTSSGDTVTIPSVTHAPILNVSPANALSSLTIQNGGFLTVGSTFTLDVSGANGALNVQASGVLDVVGTLIVSGSAGLDLDPNNSDLCPIDVQAGGILRIAAGGSHTVDEVICLSTSTSVLEFTESATFSGSGKVVGQNDSARVNIATDETLTLASGFDVEGRMEFQGLTGGTNPGTLVNEGLIHANVDGGTIHFMNNLRLNGSSGEFKASTFSTAVMQFSKQHTQLSGAPMSASFLVNDCATLDFEQSIDTSGGFTCDPETDDGGQVDGPGTLTYNKSGGSGQTASGCGSC